MIRETEPICLTWILLIPRGAWNETFLFSPDPGTTTGGSTPTIDMFEDKIEFLFLFVFYLVIFLTSPGFDSQVC